MIHRAFTGKFLWALLAATAVGCIPASADDQYQLGTQYSPLARIDKSNVADLELAWKYRTGDMPPAEFQGLFSFQDHPRLIEGNLIVCSVKRKLIALDPATGEERWVFDPEGDQALTTEKCRGIGSWVDPQASEGSQCRTRLFLGTYDYRLIAIDARTGRRCEDFGSGGVVEMPTSKPLLWKGEVAANSDPAVVNGVVVIGSAVADLQRIDAPSGRVLAFDARSGKQLWAFDPVPRDPDDPAMATWGKGTDGIGQGNVWSSMAVDQARDLVYLPTTSASDDYYGGERAGNNEYTTSVVALRGATGEVVWHQQLVHHNTWDYDLPARPVLIDYPVDGEPIPALVQNTKMGMIFIFNRETGEPLVPLVERPVPQGETVAGEKLSPTQPFPEGMPLVTPHGFSPADAWGFTFVDKWLCRNKIEKFVSGPIYTPITEQGTIVSPAIGGGPNWGGSSYDPDSHILVVPTNRVPTAVRLIPREKAADIQGMEIESNGAMRFANIGSPYVAEVIPLLSPLGAPCSKPPWAALTAVDIVNKRIVWEKPLGSIRKLAPLPVDWHLGTPGAGGPLITAGGLVFIGFSADNMFRALDLSSGEVLWEDELPAPGTAIPVTYEVDGEQYVVIPAGGHSIYSPFLSDHVVAYRLRQKGG